MQWPCMECELLMKPLMIVYSNNGVIEELRHWFIHRH